jgi:hypothetical protein
MTAEDLVRHVFSWEVSAGVPRLEADQLQPVEDE